MPTKNRKFNVAGIGFHSNQYEEEDLIYFELEPTNEFDSNAIKVLNSNLDQIGYVPREKAKELYELLEDDYRYYCAKIIEIWEGNDGDAMPKVLAHFANDPSELPYPEHEWIASSANQPKKAPILKAKLPAALNGSILVFGFIVLFGLWKLLHHLLENFFTSTVVTAVIGYLFLNVFSYFATEEVKDKVDELQS